MNYVAVPLKIKFRSFSLEKDHIGFSFAITQGEDTPDKNPLVSVSVNMPFSNDHRYSYVFDDLFLNKGGVYFVWIQHVLDGVKSEWRKGFQLDFRVDADGNLIGELLGGGTLEENYNQIDGIYSLITYVEPETVTITVE